MKIIKEINVHVVQMNTKEQFDEWLDTIEWNRSFGIEPKDTIKDNDIPDNIKDLLISSYKLDKVCHSKASNKERICELENHPFIENGKKNTELK
jgi:hypothetical protein